MTPQPQMPNAKPAEILGDPTLADARPLHLLIVAGNLALLRGHYEGVIVRLVREGVKVSVRYLKDNALGLEEYRETLSKAGVEVDVAAVSRTRRGPADKFALRLREIGNILRFSHPDYAQRTVLSERAFEKTGESAQRWGRRIRRLGSGRATLVARMLARLESTLPPSSAAAALVETVRPDAVAVVPVIRVPALVDFLKAGASRRLGTAIWVQSWDNLTNKGLLHFLPDRVFVWNESQLGELARYHGVKSDHVCVTGAQTFDHWFCGDAPVEREAFCASLRIDPERPILLYLASSRGIAPDEPAFFARWLAAVRTSDDTVLRTATVLLRPHPTLAAVWNARRFDREPGVAVSPATLRDRLNSDPFREQYRAELHHATLAFGINTSGQIDAAIFGKPVCTVELPELFHGQEGTVHFEHLARGERSLLRTASSLDEHVAVLAELVRREPYERDAKSERFIRAFVRPHGLESQPTEIFVGQMRALCETRSRLAPLTSTERTFGKTVAQMALAADATLGTKSRLLKRLRGSRGRRLRRRLRKELRRVVARVLPGPVRRAIRRALQS